MPEHSGVEKDTRLPKLKEVPYEFRIQVSVGPENIHEKRPETQERIHGGRIRTLAKELNATPVHWIANPEDYERLGQKSPGPLTYVISAVDASNKFSEGYAPCIGLVVTGSAVDEPASNISLLLHAFSEDVSLDTFKLDLEAQLKDLKAKSLNGTIDAVIFGGNGSVQQYDEVLAGLTRLIQHTLHIDPRVFDEAWAGYTDVVVDTEHRRVHMMRETSNVLAQKLETNGTDVIEGHTDKDKPIK